MSITAAAATSITTADPTGSPVCASSNAAITVGYTPTGTYNTGNVFTVQLSNAAGTFPTTPNTLTTTTTGTNSLTVTVPAGTASGTGYKVRVVASDPATTGSANPTAFTIVSNPTVSIAPTAAQSIATGANGTTLTATEAPGASSRQWYYGTTSGGPYSNAITGATGTTYTPTFAAPGTYYVVVTSTFATCAAVTSNEVLITVINPSLTVNPSSLSGFTTTQGLASAAMTYTLTGSTLTSGVTVTPPTGYQVAQSVGTSTTTPGTYGADGAAITVLQADATAGRTIYVRLSAAATTGTLSGNVTNTATNATTQSVAVSGTVNAPAPVLTPTPTALTGFTYTVGGGPSTSQSFTLTGSALTGAPGNITITGSTDYEVSSDNTNFGGTATVPYTSATLASVPVYVRLKTGLAVGTYSGETIGIAGGGATSSLTASGSVTATPTLTVAPTSLSGFTTTQGTASTPAQTYTLTGANLTSAVTVTPPAGYQLAQSATSTTTAGTYGADGAPITVTAVNAAGPTGRTIYVRLSAAAAVGTPGGNITNAATNATTQNVAVTGTVNAPTPTLTASATSFYGLDATVGTNSLAKSYTLTGANLAASVTVTAPAGYQVSQTSATSGFTNTLTVTAAAAQSGTTIYVRQVGATLGTFTGNVTNTSGSTSATVAVSGTVYSVLENFESFANASYNTTANTYASALGTATYTQTIVGNTAQDNAFDTKGTRTRGVGYIEFAIAKGVGTIGFFAGSYGSDAATFSLQYSVDNGSSYTTVPGTVSPAPTNFPTTPYSYTLNVAGPVLVRFTSTASGQRLNLDNLGITQPGTLSASPGSLAFTATTGQAAATQTYTLTGQGLPANANVAISSNDASVLVSLTGTAPFTQTATATASASGALSQVVTVQFTAPAATGAATYTISNTSGTLSAPVTVMGTATAPVAPTIMSFTPASGPVGTTVTINGTNFTSGSTVAFNGTAATAVAVNAAGTQITATVPASATTGTISVTTSGGTATSTTNFTVLISSPAGLLTLEEDFDYPTAGLLTDHHWTNNPVGSSTANLIAVAGSNQTLMTYPVGYGHTVTGSATYTGTGQDVYHTAALPSGTGTFYTSVIINLSAAQATGDYFLHLLDNTTLAGVAVYRGKVFAQASGAGYQLGLSLQSNTAAAVYGTQVYDFGTAYQVVIKYVQNTATGQDDAVSLFVFSNSAPAPLIEPSPTIGPLTEAVADAPGLNAVALRQGDTGPTLTLDGVRVATGWGSAIGRVVYQSAGNTLAAGSYYSLRVTDAVARVATSGQVLLEKTLNLDGGQVVTTTTNPLILRDRSTIAGTALTDGFEILGNGGASYVDGPVGREALGSPSFLFPVGRNGNYRPMTLSINRAPADITIYTGVQNESSAYSADALVNSPLTRVSRVRYFSITPSPVPAAGALTGTIALTYGSDDGVSDPSLASFVIAKGDGAGWNSISRTSNTSTTLTSATFQDFSNFSLASTANSTVNPLPVQLTSLAATRTAAGVQVAWATASEVNSARFVVERSLDGTTFESVATVAARGNSTAAHTYGSLDRTAPAARLYYRLRQVDMDGTSAYSPTVAVAGTAGATSELALYPNPARATLSLLTEQPTAYTIRTALGQPVLSGTTAPGTTTVPVAGLSSGVYFFELHTSTGRVVRRFTKE